MTDLRMYKKESDIFDGAFEMVDNLVNGLFSSSPRHITFSAMKVDVQETETEYVINADLPGFNKEEIKVDFRDNVLSIIANKETDTDEMNEGYVVRERKATKLSRSFCLSSIYHDKIKAKYVDGVLTLNIPKVEPENDIKTNITID